MSDDPASPNPCGPDFLEGAIAMVSEAAGLAMQGWQQADLGIDRKIDGSPVTVYDRLVESTLRTAIAERHPGDAVMGEEEEDVAGTTGRRWIIDPIDGTSPYSRGVVTWGTLVGCEDEHGSLAGIVACPWVGEHGEVVAAGRGLGATWNGRPARASKRSEVRGALVTTSSLRHWPAGALERVLGAGARVVTWGNAYGMALAATGRVDAFFDYGIKPWDLGPAPVLMAEAGGRFGALDGSNAIDRGNGLCASAELFEPLRHLLALT